MLRNTIPPVFPPRLPLNLRHAQHNTMPNSLIIIIDNNEQFDDDATMQAAFPAISSLSGEMTLMP